MNVVLLLVVMAVGMVATLPNPRTTTAAWNSANATLRECKNKQQDIYFLLDASSSLEPRDFDKIRDFVVSFVEKLDISPTATRIGLGVFAENFVHEFSLGQYSDKTSLTNAIRAVSQSDGGTYSTHTGKGLRGMRTDGFHRDIAREDATKIGVIVTDGQSRHRTTTITQARKLKNDGVWLFAIGVGRRVDWSELSIFSSEPRQDFLRHVDSVEDLRDLSLELAGNACRLKPLSADNGLCGRDQKADIIFVYNAVAMDTASLQHVQAFTAEVVKNFSMASGNVRVGVVSEGRQGDDIGLSEYLQKTDFVNALKKQPTSDVAQLLKKVRAKGFEPDFGGRPFSKKFAIVFVDNVNVSPIAILEARNMAINDDVIVYVIGVGLTDDKKEDLRSLQPSHSMFFSSYARLQVLKAKQQRFIRDLCNYM